MGMTCLWLNKEVPPCLPSPDRDHQLRRCFEDSDGLVPVFFGAIEMFGNKWRRWLPNILNVLFVHLETINFR